MALERAGGCRSVPRGERLGGSNAQDQKRASDSELTVDLCSRLLNLDVGGI